MTEIQQWFVPGRVTLLGEHLDYNGGPVLALPISRGLTFKARRREDAEVHIWTQITHDREKAVFTPESVTAAEASGWHRYVVGALGALREASVPVAGADVVIESTLPAGAGLSSSAAFLVGLVRALSSVAGSALSWVDEARIARDAEARAGASVGPLDHAVVAHGGGEALLVDCSTDPVGLTGVPVTWAESDLALVVIDTGVSHDLVTGEYATRVAECAAAVAAAGVDSLAAIDLMGMVGITDPVAKKRAQHVFTETQRVRGGVKALAAGDWKHWGAMMTASHASLRDDFEVSCPELDATVDVALESNALGARMVGAGFGGSVIALTPIDAMVGLRERILSTFEARQWQPPTLFSVRPPAE